MLLATTVAVVVLAAIERRFEGAAPPRSAAISIEQGPQYGEGQLRVAGSGDEGDLAQAVRQAGGDGGTLVIDVAPGVVQREVGRLVQSVVATTGDGVPIELHMAAE
jgi:hypothetical protein